MTVTIVGSQLGDEGKGGIVDVYGDAADVVVRYQGGDNAGHTVVHEGEEYKLSLVPSGAIRGKVGVLGNGCVVNPGTLFDELDKLRERGLEPDVRVARRAHVIFPYQRTQGSGGTEYEPIDPETMAEEYTVTFEYFQRFESELKGRENDKMEDEECWYAFTAPKSHVEHSKPKLVGAETADEARFMVDEDGAWLFKSAYGTPFPPEYADRTDYLSAYLNSSAFDYYHKHVTSLKSGGYYKYTTQYVGRAPIVTQIGDDNERVKSLVEEILELRDTELRTKRFPEAYLDVPDSDGGRSVLTHEWDDSYDPVPSAKHDQDLEGFVVEAGEETLVGQWFRDDETKAKYVAAAVSHRRVQSGDVTRIVYPESDSAIEEMLAAWRDDRSQITDIEGEIAQREAELDEIMYEQFDLTDDQIGTLDAYLTEF